MSAQEIEGKAEVTNLGLGEVVRRVLVERHSSNPLDRRNLLREPLGAVKDVEVELLLLFLCRCRDRVSDGMR